MANKIQPAIKNKPPSGVTGPTHERDEVFTALAYVSKYKEPENNSIPMIKQMPAQLIKLFEKF